MSFRRVSTADVLSDEKPWRRDGRLEKGRRREREKWGGWKKQRICHILIFPLCHFGL